VPPAADASFTDQPGVGCVVMVADCLPVLFAARNGQAVGAAHAGWRGLAAGVLENTLAAVARAAACEAAEVVTWLGPCIGPRQFEVGDEVREAFGPSGEVHFRASRRLDGSAAWLADLPALARQRLAARGVTSISGGAWCTVEGASRFFSYRRLRVSGRMAAAVALNRG
jgi:polyphenol oxidase